MEELPLPLLRLIFVRIEADGDGTDASTLSCVCRRWREVFYTTNNTEKGGLLSWRLQLASTESNPYLLHFERAMHDRALVPRALVEHGHQEDPLGLMRHPKLLALYHKLTHLYSFAIPNDEALHCLAAHQPLIEVGAGSGYWAALLRRRGVAVVALDVASASPRPTWTVVEACSDGVEAMVARLRTSRAEEEEEEEDHEGEETTALRHQQHGHMRTQGGTTDYALFLCWPPWRHPMASEALQAYEREGGRTVIYVGHESCTGDAAFHRRLEERWQLARTVDIPRWPFLSDRLFVYHHSSTIV